MTQLDSDPVYKDISSSAGPTFPYASAYVTLPTVTQPSHAQILEGLRRQSELIATVKRQPKSLSLNVSNLDEARLHEERKHNYAGDLNGIGKSTFTSSSPCINL